MNRKTVLTLTVFFLFALACNLLSLSPGQQTEEPFSTPRSEPARIGSPPLASIEITCTHHVAPDGDDIDLGTADAPWRTFQHAAEAAQTGDTVCFHAGSYDDPEEVTFSHSGKPYYPITFAAAPGEEVIVQGSLYLKQGVSYVQIIGFAVTGFHIWGITLQGDNHFIVLSGLEVTGGEAGIRMTEGDSGQEPAFGGVSDVILQNSIIHDAEATAVDCTPGPCDRVIFYHLEIYGSGIQAGFGGDGLGLERGRYILVEDCFIHDNGGDGIDLNSRDFAGNAPGIIVGRNQVARNHLQGIKLWAGGRMENNIIWGQGINPVMVGMYDGTVEVFNNTIAFNMYDPAYSERDYAFVAAYPDEGITPEVNVILVNNIFAFNTGPEVGSPTGIYLGPGVNLTESNNLFWSREDGEIQAEFVHGHDSWFTRADITDGTWMRVTGQGQGDVIENPFFVRGWPHFDAHLRPESPAINAGSPEGAPAGDFVGTARDTQPVIGAYEQYGYNP